jgi:alkylated DNA nucleotide flippase Atl1
MEIQRTNEIVAAIPAGRWMSYADVVVAAGGHPAAARRLNQHLIREHPPGAHRVLKGDGRVADNALGDPAGVRERLESEGVIFEDDRAMVEQRVRASDLPNRRAKRRHAHSADQAAAAPSASSSGT